MAKKNLIRVPARILEKLRTFDQDDVVVACAKLVRLDDISQYSQLGLRAEGGKLVVPAPSVPDPTAGRYSRANVEGYKKVRKDLPMIEKTFSFESPNWGDWSNGSHTVDHTREVYQRDFFPPKQIELSIAVLEERNDGYLLKFAVDQVLSKRTKNFELELLYNLNILQENVGAVDVFESAATLAEYSATIHVDWQILPPGTVDEVIRGMLKGRRTVTPEQEVVMRNRIKVMGRLKPDAYVVGTDKFVRYFGAQFGDDFVAFENVKYGNAIYVMRESWQELSKRSRIELLGSGLDSVERIVHRDGWEDRLSAVVTSYRSSKKRKNR